MNFDKEKEMSNELLEAGVLHLALERMDKAAKAYLEDKSQANWDELGKQIDVTSKVTTACYNELFADPDDEL